MRIHLTNILLYFIIRVFHFSREIGGLKIFDVEESYSEETYNQLKEEYDENLKSAALSTKKDEMKDVIPHTTKSFREHKQTYNTIIDIEGRAEGSTESYENAIEKLSCENPYFWNAFKCYNLDMEKDNGNLPRAKENLLTIGILVGSFSLILLIFCSCCLCICIFTSRRIKSKRTQMNEYEEIFKPGVMTFPDGTTVKYESRAEEKQEIENLLFLLTSIN